MIRDTPSTDDREREDVVVALAWFPCREYEEAIRRWPSLAEDWSDVPHGDYCARLDGNIKWMRSHGMPIHAVAPIVVEDYVAWCAEKHGSYYARWRTTDGRLLNRKVGPVRAAGGRDGLTRSEAEKEFRRMQAAEEQAPRRDRAAPARTLAEVSAALREIFGIEGPFGIDEPARRRRWRR